MEPSSHSVGPQLSIGAPVKPIGMSARWIVLHEIIFGDFCLDELDDIKLFKRKKKEVQKRQTMNFNTSKSNEKRQIKMLKTNGFVSLCCFL